ncbi:MAG: cobalt-precorrin-5B (C(1))-methyltransferase [Candidatus Methanoperedens sp.]|nr:cobalt-precorrin-5B (C(1))-methyltransferase [Candidatus Methanoperedens sp.]
MIDPVSNFQIPDEWAKRTNMTLEELKARISSGRYILLSDGSFIKRGYTTGTTAAAVAKASVLSLTKEVSEISVLTPIGIRVDIPISAKNGKACAKKDAGDHGFDATAGIEIKACAKEYGSIVIEAGQGIGRKKGAPAINPIPLYQIEEAIKEALVETGLKGSHVNITIPDGKNIAKLTLNERTGITGGISILGTTGFVEPWNEHLGEMKEELIRKSDKVVVLTTGRLGVCFSNMFFPDHDVILIGSDISRGLLAARENKKVIIAGLPGLILKWAASDILRRNDHLTFMELIEADPGNSLIDVAHFQAVRSSGKRVVLFNRDGTILRDSGEP